MKLRIAYALCVAVMGAMFAAAEVSAQESPNPTIMYDTIEIEVGAGRDFRVVSDIPTVKASVELNGGYGYKRDVMEPNFKALMIDGTFVPMAVVLTENGRTLVPARIVSENMAAEVLWDGNARSVTITRGGTKIAMTADDRTAYVNGSPVTLDAPVKNYNGVTYVPVRFIAESLGGKAGYTVIKGESEIVGHLGLPVVWIESPEFSSRPKISNSDVMNEIRSVVVPDIEANFFDLAKEIKADPWTPLHFDAGQAYKVTVSKTEALSVISEFSCYAVVGAWGDISLIFNKVTRELYVFNESDFSAMINRYNFPYYWSSLNLQ